MAERLTGKRLPFRASSCAAHLENTLLKNTAPAEKLRRRLNQFQLSFSSVSLAGIELLPMATASA
jgi:hypothetical protein